MTDAQSRALFGGGCFWCLEAVFRAVPGVQEVVSGYAGGDTIDPSYRQVCSGNTGHAEVVEIHFDPARVSFAHLLEVFFTIHDPTQLNRQGHDVGSQYRSVVFCLDAQQREATRRAIAALADDGRFDAPIVTEIAEPATFYPAEAEHQDYFENNARQPYCQLVVAPKLNRYHERFGQ